MKVRPNIVVVIASEIDYENINCMNQTLTGYSGLAAANYAAKRTAQGRLLTPTLDAMAGEGRMFMNYWAASGSASAARYSMFTGRLPERSAKFTGAEQADIWGNVPLDKAEDSLPRALRNSGYHTGIFGKWSNYSDESLKRIDMCYQSFQSDSTWDSTGARLGVRRAREIARAELTGDMWDEAERLYGVDEARIRPAELAQPNLDWIIEGAADYITRSAEGAKPFFACVSLPFPQGRYSGDRFLNANALATPDGMLNDPPQVLPSHRAILERVRAAGMPDSAAEGLLLDECVRALKSALRRAGAENNTCFVFTGDCPSAGEGSAHLGRIPLIVHWPDIARPGVDLSLISQTGLAKTLLDAAGCAQISDISRDGRGFIEAITQGARVESEPFIETANCRALVSGEYKYIINRLPDEDAKTLDICRKSGWHIDGRAACVHGQLDTYFPGYFDTDQLYDVRCDPLEQHNIVLDPRYADVAADMKDKIESRIAALPHDFGEIARHAGKGAQL